MRPGTTLIELLIFLAVVVAVGTALFPLLFASTEDRLLQQTASLVEQNGTQLLQTIANHVRHSERIVDPALGGTGSVLTLQTGSGSTNPTIIGLSSGALILVQHTTRQTLSSSQVAVIDFEVRNTSTSASRQSVWVSFRISRTIRLQAPRHYTRMFEGVFTLFPDDVIEGDSCHCAVPGCDGAGKYVWEVCENSVCLNAETALEC